MGREQLLRVLPFVRESVIENRAAAELTFVAAVLKANKVPSQFTAAELAAAVNRSFPGVEFSTELVAARIHDLEERHCVSRVGAKFRAENLSAFESAANPLEILIEQFPKAADFQLPAGYWSSQPAWKEGARVATFCILEELLASLGTRGSEKFEIAKGAHNRRRLIREVATVGIGEPERFTEAWLQFIEARQKAGDETVDRLLHAALQYDLLCRSEELHVIASEIASECVVFLDTNILIGLMCPEDLAHNVCASAARMSNRAGYPLRFLAESRREFELRVQGWLSSYQQTGPLPTLRDLARNPIADHWSKVKRQMSWAEFEAHYLNFADYLNSEFSLQEWTGAVEYPDKEFLDDFRHRYALAKAHGTEKLRPHTYDADYHDGTLLLTVSELHRRAIVENDVPPVTVTFDTGLWMASKALASHRSDFTHAIHKVPYWLRRTSALLGPKVDEKMRRSLISALLANAYDSRNPTLTVQNYLDAIAVRAELKSATEERLRVALASSDIRAEVETLVEEGEYERAQVMLSQWIASPEVAALIDQSKELTRTSLLLQHASATAVNENRMRREAEARVEIYEKITPTVLSSLAAGQQLQQSQLALLQGMMLTLAQLNPEWTEGSVGPVLAKCADAQRLKATLMELSDVAAAGAPMIKNGTTIATTIRSFLQMMGLT